MKSDFDSITRPESILSSMSGELLVAYLATTCEGHGTRMTVSVKRIKVNLCFPTMFCLFS